MSKEESIKCRVCGTQAKLRDGIPPAGWFASSEGTFACSYACVNSQFRNKEKKDEE